MTTRTLRPVALALTAAALCLGCPSKSSDTTVTPATESTPPKPGASSLTPPTTTPAAAATASKSQPLSAEDTAQCVKQIMAGHTVHAEHSFRVNLKGFEGSVLSTTGPDGKVFVFHVFNATGKRTISLFDKGLDKKEARKILAVAFEDVDHDSFEDLVVLASYADGNAVSVYVRPAGGQFSHNAPLSTKAGKPTSMAAALAALR